MELQSSLEFDPSTMGFLNYGGFLLPSDEYATMLTNFPAANCNWYWDTHGDFFITFHIYDDGIKVGEFHTSHRTENGYFHLNLDEITSLLNRSLKGFVHIEYHHSKKIPPEMYFSHRHRTTGAYVAYPPMAFAGDTVHNPLLREQEIENALFWPGVENNHKIQMGLRIPNPYKLPFQYQISLFLKNRRRVQSKAFKVSKQAVNFHTLDDLFPEHLDDIAHSAGDYSLSVAAQFKVLAYVQFVNRATGVITTIDHLHRFYMY